MSTDNAEQPQRFGCYPLLRGVLIVLWCIIVGMLLLHHPIDYFQLVGYTVVFALMLVFANPWSEPLILRFPWLGMVFSLPFGFISIYPLVTRSPIDYFQLLMTVASVLLLSFFASPWFPRIIRKPWFQRIFR